MRVARIRRAQATFGERGFTGTQASDESALLAYPALCVVPIPCGVARCMTSIAGCPAEDRFIMLVILQAPPGSRSLLDRFQTYLPRNEIGGSNAFIRKTHPHFLCV